MCRGHHRESSDGESCPASLLQSDTFTPSALRDTLDHLHPMPIDSVYSPRRRSVDIGGLSLALNTVSLGDEGTGKGWGGWEENEAEETHYAELLSDMYKQTQSAVNMPIISPPPRISNETRKRLIKSLDSWHFEPHLLPDDEVLACAQLLFEVLFRVEGMSEAIGVSLAQMGSFLVHLRQAYRSSNSYHNFQHALDVFQATHMYLRKAGAVPPVSFLLTDSNVKWRPPPIRNSVVAILRNEDLFALCIAAVGHDVGHPGFNNIFMKNAQAPLSQVYDHKSALERMHCAFLLPIMKRHGLEHLLDRRVDGASFRKLLLETVLATDMGVHKNFMERFKSLIEHPEKYDVAQARILVCQALIKCADISNPSRPHSVSQHWSAALAAEWASQALLERQLHLPVSVQESDDPSTEAKGQISFIQAFCLPLLEITAAAIPEMKCFVDQCILNCQQWAKRLVELSTQPEPNYPPVPYRSTSTSPHQVQIQDFLSVFPLSLPVNFQVVAFEERMGRFSTELDRERDRDRDNASVSSHSHSVSYSGSGSGSSVATPSCDDDGSGLSSSSRAPSPYTVTSVATSVYTNGYTSAGVNGVGFGAGKFANENGVVNGATPVAPQASSLQNRPLPAAISTVGSVNGGSSTVVVATGAAVASGSRSGSGPGSTSGSVLSSPSAFAPVFSHVDYSAMSTAETPVSPLSDCAPHQHTHTNSVSSVNSMASAVSSGVNGYTNGLAHTMTSSSSSLPPQAPLPSVPNAQEPISSIRAAYRLSVRKKKSFHHHRNSWAPSPSSLSVVAGVGFGKGVVGVRDGGGGGGVMVGTYPPSSPPPPPPPPVSVTNGNGNGVLESSKPSSTPPLLPSPSSVEVRIGVSASASTNENENVRDSGV